MLEQMERHLRPILFLQEQHVCFTDHHKDMALVSHNKLEHAGSGVEWRV